MPIVYNVYTLGKSSDQSPGNFDILGKITISRKSLFSKEKYIILEVIYQIFILIYQFTQLSYREKYGYPSSVKSHLIIQFMGLKTEIIKETLVFSEKDVFLNCKISFQYKVIINPVFITRQ